MIILLICCNAVDVVCLNMIAVLLAKESIGAFIKRSTMPSTVFAYPKSVRMLTKYMQL